MKKDKFYLDKFFILQLSKLLLLQVIFAVVTIISGAGGHGIMIPGIILYGPTLILLSPLASVINSVVISFLLVIAILLAIFLLFYFIFPTIKALKLLLLFHWLGVLLLLIYSGFVYGFASYMPFSQKLFTITASLIISFFYWYMFFQVLKYKSNK